MFDSRLSLKSNRNSGFTESRYTYIYIYIYILPKSVHNFINYWDFVILKEFKVSYKHDCWLFCKFSLVNWCTVSFQQWSCFYRCFLDQLGVFMPLFRCFLHELESKTVQIQIYSPLVSIFPFSIALFFLIQVVNWIPIQLHPTQSNQIKSNPTQWNHIQSSPSQSNQIQSNRMQLNQIRSTPTQTNQIKCSSLKTSPSWGE